MHSYCRCNTFFICRYTTLLNPPLFPLSIIQLATKVDICPVFPSGTFASIFFGNPRNISLVIVIVMNQNLSLTGFPQRILHCFWGVASGDVVSHVATGHHVRHSCTNNKRKMAAGLLGFHWLEQTEAHNNIGSHNFTHS